jgi:hypothetical protein
MSQKEKIYKGSISNRLKFPVHDFNDVIFIMREFIHVENILKDPDVENENVVKVMAEGALNFAISHVNILHTWYGLVTGDWHVETSRVDAAFMDSTLHMNTNPFYDLYKPLLVGPMLSAQIRWITGRVFEQEAENKDDLTTAYTAISGLFDIFPIIVYAFFSTINLGSPVKTQTSAMRNAHAFSIAMQAVVRNITLEEYLDKHMKRIGEK